MQRHFIIVFLVVVLLLVVVATTTTSSSSSSTDALVARRLVNSTTYGVLTTMDFNGFPFGNVVSHADGGTGTPFFYLALDRDPTGIYAQNNSKSSFTLSQATLGSCGTVEVEAQSPNCTKITLTGEVKLLDPNSAGAKFGLDALFAAHPTFARWPLGHDFGVFVLNVDRIFLVNGYKPAVDLSLGSYYNSMSHPQSEEVGN